MFRVLICCLIVTLVGIGNVVCQEIKTTKKNIGGSTLLISSYKEIPAATEQCSPAECDWWNHLRHAANELQQKNSEKSKRKFVTLFVEGMEKSYRVPLKNRQSQMLVTVRPSPLKNGVRAKNGKVILLVEVRSDSSVGEIKVEKSLRSDMDELCIQAQRQSIYLPAVKENVFSIEWQKVECGFWSRNGVN